MIVFILPPPCNSYNYLNVTKICMHVTYLLCNDMILDSFSFWIVTPKAGPIKRIENHDIAKGPIALIWAEMNGLECDST
jgi:hypothetical protein